MDTWEQNQIAVIERGGLSAEYAAQTLAEAVERGETDWRVILYLPIANRATARVLTHLRPYSNSELDAQRARWLEAETWRTGYRRMFAFGLLEYRLGIEADTDDGVENPYYNPDGDLPDAALEYERLHEDGR